MNETVTPVQLITIIIIIKMEEYYKQLTKVTVIEIFR